MTRLFACFALVAYCLVPHATLAADAISANRRYEATVESLSQWSTPEWFRDAKLGIFIHWGPYAVPGYASEWYPRRMYQEFRTTPKGVVSTVVEPVFQHHRAHWGDQSQFGYKDFVPMFKGENWDPHEWVALFKKAGAKYVVPVAEHHDGFAMYDSSQTPWNAVDKGPKRDIVGDLRDACLESELRFGVSSHFAWNWRYYTYEDRFDTSDPSNSALYSRPHDGTEPADKEFLDHWFARTKEIVDKYSPEVLWFDFGFNYPEFAEVRARLAAYYYNNGRENSQEVVLQYKEGLHGTPFPAGAGLLDIERGKLADIRDLPWQTDTSVSKKSWAFIEDDVFKSSDDLIDDLIDIVSKNGCLLLNVGPRADGTIPEAAQQVLLDMGAWLDIYGESIYGTRPWKVFGEGPTVVVSGHHTEGKNPSLTSKDFRFTQKDGRVYAIGMAWPSGELVRIAAMGASTGLLDGPVRSVELVGDESAVQWEQQDEALVVTLPSGGDWPRAAYALRIEQ